MKAALKSGVEKGILIQNKQSYKVSAEGKKAAKKKPAAKAKTTTKKKVSEALLRGFAQLNGSQSRFSSFTVHRRTQTTAKKVSQLLPVSQIATLYHLDSSHIRLVITSGTCEEDYHEKEECDEKACCDEKEEYRCEGEGCPKEGEGDDDQEEGDYYEKEGGISQEKGYEENHEEAVDCSFLLRLVG